LYTSNACGCCGLGQFPLRVCWYRRRHQFGFTNDFWEYNYFTDSWTQRASLPGPGRKDATAFVINGIAYVGTGYSAGFTTISTAIPISFLLPTWRIKSK
jgi:hypothetical protein